jgi:uncharacterized membrane protein
VEKVGAAVAVSSGALFFISGSCVCGGVLWVVAVAGVISYSKLLYSQVLMGLNVKG